MLEIKHLRKEYPNSTPLKDVNALINKGDVIAVIGPSGTGKSTLIRCINQLDKPTSGEIIFHGKDICKDFDKETKLKIGMVFQSYNLFANLTAIENVMCALVDNKKIAKKVAYEKAMDLLDKVGLKERAFRYPSQLSGGQQQRVAIARTLAMEPELILLDEPTSALDPTTVSEIEKVIKQMVDNGHTMMIVTHSMSLAKNIANRVFYMDEGGIYEDGTPEQIFNNPLKPKTKAFVNQDDYIEIYVNDKSHDFYKDYHKIITFLNEHETEKIINQAIATIFEEAIYSILLEELVNEKICFKLIYRKDTKKYNIEIRYGGKPYNFFESKNKLALKYIKVCINDYHYSTIDNVTFTNLVVIE